MQQSEANSPSKCVCGQTKTKPLPQSNNTRRRPQIVHKASSTSSQEEIQTKDKQQRRKPRKNKLRKSENVIETKCADSKSISKRSIGTPVVEINQADDVVDDDVDDDDDDDDGDDDDTKKADYDVNILKKSQFVVNNNDIQMYDIHNTQGDEKSPNMETEMNSDLDKKSQETFKKRTEARVYFSEVTRSIDNDDRYEEQSEYFDPYPYKCKGDRYHLRSCCGICNLFPGVILTSLLMISVGTTGIVLSMIYTEALDKKMYGEKESISLMLLSVFGLVCVLGIFLFLTMCLENGRLLFMYIIISFVLLIAALTVSIIMISKGCGRDKELFFNGTQDGILKPSQLKRMTYANTGCSSGLFMLFLSCLYFVGLWITFSFYHYRHLRRAKYMHALQTEGMPRRTKRYS